MHALIKQMRLGFALLVCACLLSCVGTVADNGLGPENTPDRCHDKIDNDQDNLTDCSEPDCAAFCSIPAEDNQQPEPDGGIDSPAITEEAAGDTDGPSADQDPITQWLDSTLAAMSQDQRIGQLLFLRYQADCNTIADLQPGGVVYFGDDITNEQSLRQANLSLQACARDRGMAVPIFSSTNHEGGRIYYFDSGSQVTHFASAQVQCQHGMDYVYQVSKAQAEELTYCGVDVTLGPDTDVLFEPASNVIGDRAYGSTPGPTADCVESAMRGYHEGQDLAVLKHFPGHGGTAADTHAGMAVDDASLVDVETNYLVPFWRGLDHANPAEFVMVSHVWFQNIDPSWPAGLSLTILNLFKNSPSHPFKGVATTDEMTMGAVANYWGVDTASMLALMAGVDMLMMQDLTAARSFRTKLKAAWDNGWSAQVQDAQGRNQSISFTKDQVQGRILDAVRRILRLKREKDRYTFETVLAKINNAPAPDWSTHHTLANQAKVLSIEAPVSHEKFPACEKPRPPLLMEGP